MDLNTSNRVNENERHEKIAVIANDLSNWRYYSHNGEDTAWAFPVIDENKYSANIAWNGTVTIKKKQVGGEISFDSTYLADIDNIKNNVPKNEKEEAWQKADWYLAENILRAIEKAEKEENDKKASTKKDLGTTLEGANGFWKGFSLESLISMFKKTGFDRTKLFGDTKINPVSATAKIPSSAKKSPNNSDDKIQPVESSQSHIDSNIDINDIIHQIIERMAPKGKESIEAVKATCQPMIIEIMIHGDGTATVKTGSQRTHANSSSNRVEPVEGEEPILPKRESQKTKPVSSNVSGIENAIAGLEKAAAATQEAPKPNQELINVVNRLSQMNKQVKDAKVDIPTPNHDAAVENERKELEKIWAIMDDYNTMIERIPWIIAWIDKTTTGNEEKITDITTQLESLGRNIEGYIEKLTKEVKGITSKFGTQNLNQITALCEKLKELAGTFEKATAAVSGTGEKTPETTETNWDKIKETMKKALSTIKIRGEQEWNTFTSKLNGFLSQCWETAKTWKEKFTTLLQQFIKWEKNYGTIKGEIEKEENSEIKGLLLVILEEVKKIKEQLESKENTNTGTTVTPKIAENERKIEAATFKHVVENPESNKDNKGENAEENSDNSITKIWECPKWKPNNYETYKIDYPKVGTKYKTQYWVEVSIVKYLKDDNWNWKVVLNKDPILWNEEEVTDSIESIIFFYLQENANNKRKRVNEEKTKNETRKQDETGNTNANQQDKMEKQQESNKDSNQQLKQGKPQEKQAIIHAPISAEDPQMYDKLLWWLKAKPHKKEKNVENPENEESVPQKRENHETNNLTDVPVPVNQGNISSTNTNTQWKENSTPNTSQPAKGQEKKSALSRFSAQVGEKIKNAWNWFKGLFKKKEKQSKTETAINTPKKPVSSQPRKTTNTTSENIENDEKPEFTVGDQYYNGNNLAFTVLNVDGDNIEIMYAYENRKSTSTRDELERSIKQNKFKKKEKEK